MTSCSWQRFVFAVSLSIALWIPLSIGGLHFSPPSLSFGGVCLFCVERLNVTLVNPSSKLLLIEKHHLNDSQFMITPLPLLLEEQSSVRFEVVFSARSAGPLWSHLSVHTEHGVLYLYLHAVGMENKYGIEYVAESVPSSPTVSISISITNPWPKTLELRSMAVEPNSASMPSTMHQLDPEALGVSMSADSVNSKVLRQCTLCRALAAGFCGGLKSLKPLHPPAGRL